MNLHTTQYLGYWKKKADKIPVRAYYCKWCNLYHLSSQQRLNIKTGVIG